MEKWVKNIGVLLSSIIAIMVLILWFTGIIGLWLNGMAYVANNTKVFTDTKGHLLSGEYSITINLNDLQSNIGKELYNHDNNRIYISWIDNTGNSNTGGYRIGFRSCGQYSLTNATLVSGARHATVNDNSFTTYMTAKMTAKYNGKVYNSGVFSTSGLNYKKGDDFAFYIFPSESYKDGEVSLNEKGTVELSITNLYENIWIKK
jgi:hypothetical protein